MRILTSPHLRSGQCVLFHRGQCVWAGPLAEMPLGFQVDAIGLSEPDALELAKQTGMKATDDPDK